MPRSDPETVRIFFPRENFYPFQYTQITSFCYGPFFSFGVGVVVWGMGGRGGEDQIENMHYFITVHLHRVIL